ncbi:MAG: inositol-3-phosphate synthase [Acidobacteria bacterium]|nr:inositol-3-phosphate synthase [Acidobacteriota bacterium]
MAKRKLGIAVVGIGGAVGTTMAAGVELLRQNAIDTTGLPLAGFAELADYTDIEFAGWDLFENDLATAAENHEVLSLKQFAAVQTALGEKRPWPALADTRFLSNIAGTNVISLGKLRDAVEQVRADIREFRAQCDAVCVVNLASTEALTEADNVKFASLVAFEKAIDENAPEISPAMLYAYAAIAEGVPYANFTPSLSADIPALVEFAEKNKVPLAGKDGKTGQTFIKTVLAPALRSRALHIDGWYSTNILGNRDGLALSNDESLASKIRTKSSVLDDMLGYEVEDHLVDIRYYRPRGDNKEAWDNIDISGFLGQRMQIKVNFLCRDSILAAPLAIEIARCLDLARERAEFGIQEQLSVFFKLPMTRDSRPEHAFHTQEKMLLDWLDRR